MLTVAFDAAPLITACKFRAEAKLAVDHLAPVGRILVPPSVEEEVAVVGAAYADGVAAAERIARGEMEVCAVQRRQ